MVTQRPIDPIHKTEGGRKALAVPQNGKARQLDAWEPMAMGNVSV